MQRFYDDTNEPVELRRATVDAYLVLPFFDAPVSSFEGPGEAGYMVDPTIVEPMLLEALKKDYEHKFIKAVHALKLEWPHRYRPTVGKVKGKRG